MNQETLLKAAKFVEKAKHVFIATADTEGWPLITPAGRAIINQERHLILTEWFSAGVMANLEANPRVAVLVWDEASDRGYHLVAEMEQMKDLDVLNGFVPGVESKGQTPQVERQLLLHIDKITEFKHVPAASR